MESTTTRVRLNQQQVELVDDACARLGGTSRAEALRTALRDHAAELLADARSSAAPAAAGTPADDGSGA